MLKRFDRNTRRILTFPAVLPCQHITPATLLQSLITLSDSITNHQSEFFPTQRRNARECIRQITILSMLFSEIIERKASGLPDSAMLCFSELHHSFQKVRFLLEDCTRSGSRVWMLMLCRFVAMQFSLLIRAIATALDVLPLNSIDVSSDVKELVKIVAIQARRATMEVDSIDGYAMKRVLAILNQFEKGFEPDSIMIRRALYHLGINSWSECHEEILFLNEEISLELVDDDKRDFNLLYSLTGFMKYCRGVLFEYSVLDNSDDRSVGKANVESLSCLNPEDFRCPISLELMTDPVTVTTGQTYDRVSIKKWLNSGKLICPKTGEKLKRTEFIPNLNLKKVIQQYCINHRVQISKFQNQNRDISSSIHPGSRAYAETIKFLSEFLVTRLCNGTEEQKNRAAYEIRLLAKSNIFNRFSLIETGAIPPLLTLLSSSDSTTQENAIAGLLKLSKHSNGKTAIINHGGLNSIINILKNGLKEECKQIAAATIFYLSSMQTNQHLITEAIPALIEQIQSGTSLGKMYSLAALYAILLNPRTHNIALSHAIIPLLFNHISTSRKPEIATGSLAVVSILAESFEGSHRILYNLSLSPIIKSLQTSRSRASKEYCVSILLALCNNIGDVAIAFLASYPNLFGLLYTLLTSGGSAASRKAESLIRIMHRFHETSSSGLMDNWDSSRIAAVGSC